MNFDRVVLVAGTRPEFVKLHPVAMALSAAGVDTILLTTEQHSSPAMKGAFFDELVWPCGVRSLGILGSAHLLRKATEPFRNREPDWPDRMRELCRLAALEESDRATGRERGPW